jgi:hypothetical protein
MRTTPGIPRHLGRLHDGPWLCDRTAVRVWGWIGFVAVGVVIGALVVGPLVDYRSALAMALLLTMLLGAFVAVCSPLVMLGVWIQGRSIQYCPDCLQYMTRGARVCPFCGFREEQTPTATPAATPRHRPRRSA